MRTSPAGSGSGNRCPLAATLGAFLTAFFFGGSGVQGDTRLGIVALVGMLERCHEGPPSSIQGITPITVCALLYPINPEDQTSQVRPAAIDSNSA